MVHNIDKLHDCAAPALSDRMTRQKIICDSEDEDLEDDARTIPILLSSDSETGSPDFDAKVDYDNSRRNSAAGRTSNTTPISKASTGICSFLHS